MNVIRMTPGQATHMASLAPLNRRGSGTYVPVNVAALTLSVLHEMGRMTR